MEEEKEREETVRSGYKVLKCSRACFRVMSLESRSSSALFKRAEQLKRWEQSETNREPTQPRQIARKIKFSADCVFLAACAAGDKEEVVRLLQKGADINTGNVDGLTALHQVKFLDSSSLFLFIFIIHLLCVIFSLYISTTTNLIEFQFCFLVMLFFLIIIFIAKCHMFQLSNLNVIYKFFFYIYNVI